MFRGTWLEERRRAVDGLVYTRSDFEDHYQELWQQYWDVAHSIPLEAPKGLTVCTLACDGSLLDAALTEEVLPAFVEEYPQGVPDGGLEVVEAGVSFHQSSYKEDEEMPDNSYGTGYTVVAKRLRSINAFPKLKRLLGQAMDLLSDDSAPGKEECTLDSPMLNVIVRRYSQGHGIGFHTDKKDWFQEQVFGLVLQNTSDRSLEFMRVDTGEEAWFAVEEYPGICFCQKGEARFQWVHGVRGIRTGTRISVTWRWFQPASLAENV